MAEHRDVPCGVGGRSTGRDAGTSTGKAHLQVVYNNTGRVPSQVLELRDELKRDNADKAVITETMLDKVIRSESVFPGGDTTHWRRDRSNRDKEA